MPFTDCAAQFAAYVAETLQVSVHFEDAGVPIADTIPAHTEFDVRVVTSNHPGGVVDPPGTANPPTGINLQDVRLRLQITGPSGALLLVDDSIEGTTFRSGWDVDAWVLTPDKWVPEMYVHFGAEHPTFALPTSDPLDQFIVRCRSADTGPIQITATARATPCWPELSQPAQSPMLNVA